MGRAKHDLLVVGAGPGGYIAAIRAAQLGLDVGCIEKEPRLGGTCLRVGCIPSKALLESSELFWEARIAREGKGFAQHGLKIGGLELDLERMMTRKEGIVGGLAKGVEGLLGKNKIRRYQGHARFTGPRTLAIDTGLTDSGKGEDVVEAEHVLLATGSRVAELRGVELDGERVGTSTEALSWSAVPERLVVIGAGAIGLELGAVWSRLGAEVIVLEYLERILPGMDAEIAAVAKKLLEKQGLVFRLGSRVTGARSRGRKPGCTVELEGGEPIECEKVLLAVGRVPNTDGLGLDAIGLATDEKGRVPIDEAFRTSVEGVYAIGDLVRGPMLAHKAEEEGVACVERIVTGYGHVDYDAIPNVVYTAPEIASVGRSEEELKEAGVAYRKGSFRFLANGRARALGHTDGLVKVLADLTSDRLLGVHVVGPRAGDLIAEAAVAIAFGASSEDLARACHAHPTLAECLKEAALAVDGRAIHS